MPTGCRPTFPPLRTAGRAPEQPADPADDLRRPRARSSPRPPTLLDATRLLTLTGPGGTGKTRLSLAARDAASRTASPTASSSCRSSRSATRCSSPPRIAAALGVAESGAPADRRDARRLARATRRVLLVLDNFEQVIEAAPVVADLLRAAPGPEGRSRRAGPPLHVSGEQEYPVPGLPAPPDPCQLSALERLQPARRRARARRRRRSASTRRSACSSSAPSRSGPAFAVTNENAPAVAAISARLHGMPLAIELAAARVKLLSPDAILARLEHQLDVLAAGARDLPARQQTLRGAIAWSYDLLDDGGRRLLDRLSVFAGRLRPRGRRGGLRPGRGARRRRRRRPDGARRPEPRPDRGDARRRAALPPARDDPRVRRASGSRRAARRDAIERPPSRLVRGPRRDAPRRSSSGDDQRHWLDRLELEHDNIRAVARPGGRARPTRRSRSGSAFAMWRFWQKHGHLAEARRRLDAMDAARLVARRSATPGAPARGARRHLLVAGRPRARCSACYQEALEIWQEIGDEREIANAYYNVSFAYAVGDRTDRSAPSDPDADRRARTLEEALDRFRRIGDDARRGQRPVGPRQLHYFRGRPGRRRDRVPAALELFRGERRPDDGGLGPPHARDRAPAPRRRSAEAREHVDPRHPRTSTPPATSPG